MLFMDNYTVFLSKDLYSCREGTGVCVTGIIQNRWSNKNRFGIEIEDLTGTARISFTNSKASFDRNSLVKGKRVRTWGVIAIDKKGNLYVGSVDRIEILEEISLLNNELDIIEQESLVSMSKICNTIRELLTGAQFVEISSRVISRRIGDEIFEPLLIDYPGFGSSVFLSPSPSSQLSEFLTVTMLPKVFTLTSSFSSSYRFPNGASELPIIMAKAINLTELEESNVILHTTNRIVESLSNESITIKHFSDKWDNRPFNISKKKNEFSLLDFETDIPTMGKFWTSTVYKLRCLHDDNGNLLIECAHEKVNEHTDICSITFYPSQFLNWISKAPKRQLQNLWKLYDGGIIYG